MSAITIRTPWAPDSLGRVQSKLRPSSLLRFGPENLAPGVEIGMLVAGVQVDYDLIDAPDGTRIENLRPLVVPTAVPEPAREEAMTDGGAPEDRVHNPAPLPPAPPGADISKRFPRNRSLGGWTGKAPYTFVQITQEGGVNAGPLRSVVTHCGTPTDSEDLYSGELLVELRALTPLLVGQYRYQWDQLVNDSKNRIIPGAFATKKSILEPLTLKTTTPSPAAEPAGRPKGEDGWTQRNVVLPAPSIKGPIRQAIAAILKAPMERVGDAQFTYRPNLTVVNEDHPRIRYFPAVVNKVYSDGTLSVTLVEGHNKVKFVESPVAAYLHIAADTEQREEIERNLVPGAPLPIGGMHHYRPDENRFLFEPGLEPGVRFGYRVYHYATGIDGSAQLATEAKKSHEDGEPSRFRHHFRALVQDTDLGETLDIDEATAAQYQRTQKILADEQHGHLSRLPGRAKISALGDISDTIKRNKPKPNQLIYVEVQMEDKERRKKVLSYGTHFRYRWAYSDSIHHRLVDAVTGETQTRAELGPAPGEGLKESEAHEGRVRGDLTGARLLFGYVSDAKTETEALGAKAASRLAGRIAFNHAVEVIDADRESAESRFLYLDGLEGDARFLLPLRILGQPKPSAVEHYVDQSRAGKIRGATVTYGDVQGEEPRGGALNGRKFYRHQPVEIVDGPLTGKERFLAETEEVCLSDQATLARLVSRPGARFRLRVRFRELRIWELGALLIAIEPDLLASLDEGELDDRVSSVITKARAKAEAGSPLFALKMGYARPLGFGSVAMCVQYADLLGPESQLTRVQDTVSWKLDAVRAFLNEMKGDDLALADWLEVCRYAGRVKADYPRSDDGKIFTHHTEIRKEHSKQRREKDIGADRQYDRPIWSGDQRDLK